ncbi:MAG: response regulator [Deltaproteobacteria bacterium]|nr:response regulator [Deltaproteobacteria bacterium]
MKRILVADKDKQTVKMVSTMLTLEGYQVAATSNAEEFLPLVSSLSPHVILLDYLLQQILGETILSDIKACDVNTEIILMTTYGTDFQVAEMLDKGLSEYLVKPFSKGELLQAVESSIYARENVEKDSRVPKLLLSAENRSEMKVLEKAVGEFGYCESILLRHALSHLSKNRYDVWVADVSVADVDIIELIRKISLRSPGTDIIFLADSDDISLVKNVIREGAFDCLFKPLSERELEKTLSELFQKRRKRSIESLKKKFERELKKNREQLDYIVGIVESMVFALETKDRYTRGHSERVTMFAIEVAKAMKLDKSFVEMLRHASRLHDIGKIGINDSILKKPSRLTDEEQSIMKSHPVVGESILKPVRYLSSLLPAVRHHHERYDGTGYPDKLREEGIPLEARIISVVDAFDAMRSNRPYRDKIDMIPVMDELERCAGTQFDPHVVKVFLSLVENESMFEEAYNL